MSASSDAGTDTNTRIKPSKTNTDHEYDRNDKFEQSEEQASDTKYSESTVEKTCHQKNDQKIAKPVHKGLHEEDIAPTQNFPLPPTEIHDGFLFPRVG